MQRLRQLLKTLVTSILIFERRNMRLLCKGQSFSKVKNWTLLPDYEGSHFSVQLAVMSCKTHESAELNFIF